MPGAALECTRMLRRGPGASRALEAAFAALRHSVGKARGRGEAFDAPSRHSGDPNFCPVGPETAGHPGRRPIGAIFRLEQALSVTGTSPVTAAHAPVTIAVGAMMVGLTGAVPSVTGKGPVASLAYLRRFPPPIRDRPGRPGESGERTPPFLGRFCSSRVVPAGFPVIANGDGASIALRRAWGTCEQVRSSGIFSSCQPPWIRPVRGDPRDGPHRR